MDKVEEIKTKLSELEDRAEQLDKQRSQGISAIRFSTCQLQGD